MGRENSGGLPENGISLEFWVLSAREWPGGYGFLVVFSPLPRNLFFHDALYRKRIVIARTDGYAKHCNSCLLIISASISRSKPPANADRTLSLSRSPHFVPPTPNRPRLPTVHHGAVYICTWSVRDPQPGDAPSSTGNPLWLGHPCPPAPPPALYRRRTHELSIRPII